MLRQTAVSRCHTIWKLGQLKNYVINIIKTNVTMSKIIIKVKEIRGNCVVFKVGEKIVIDGPEIDLNKTDKICIHALASLLHYVVALREGIDPVKLGLAKKGDKAYIQCVDPGTPYTNGGTVIFEVSVQHGNSHSNEI